MGATLGPALIGVFLRHCMANNAAMIGSAMTDTNTAAVNVSLGQLYGTVQLQALVVSMKEIYGWLTIAAIIALTVIIVGYGPVRPSVIFPKWRTIRKLIRSSVRPLLRT